MLIVTEGSTRHPAVTQRDQVGANLFLAQRIGRAPIMLGQPAHRGDIASLRPQPQSHQLHVFDHALTQRCHHYLPLVEYSSGPNSRATPKDTPIAHPDPQPTSAKPSVQANRADVEPSQRFWQINFGGKWQARQSSTGCPTMSLGVSSISVGGGCDVRHTTRSMAKFVFRCRGFSRLWELDC